MLRVSFALILLASLNTWCTSLNLFKLPEIPVLQKITKLSTGIPVCLYNDPNISNCIKNTYRLLKSRLKNGVDVLNIPSLDPLEIDTFKMFIELINGDMQLDHFRIFGIDNTEVEDVSLNVNGDSVKLNLNTKTPHIYHEGIYEVNFIKNNEKTNREGYFNGTLTDLKLKMAFEGDLAEREGNKYVNVKKFHFETDIANLTFYAENLAEDAVLNAFILDHINNNWSSYYKFFLDGIKKDLEPIALNILNSYADTIPVDLFFDL